MWRLGKVEQLLPGRDGQVRSAVVRVKSGYSYKSGRIELRNLQILKNMLEKSSQFLSSEQPSESKSLDVALNIVGVEKLRSENL